MMGRGSRSALLRAPFAGAAVVMGVLVTAALTLVAGWGHAQAGPGPAPVLVAGTPCTTTARACVDLEEREAWLIDDDSVVRGPVPIRDGDEDSPTPRGVFTVEWKAEQYTSRESQREMPYSVFFAAGGIAFHEGPHDSPSAGCVRLQRKDAEAWFAHLQVGDEVQIH
jgi:hypothetical protein